MIQPIFFSSKEKPLYGINYLPVKDNGKQIALLFCNSIGQEYINSNKFLASIAFYLRNHGYHSFRFDYAGTGDSYGTSTDFSIDKCIDNIIEAAKRLKQQHGINYIVLLGLRFGALVSVLAHSLSDIFDGIILWEPVIKGEDYLKELKVNQKNWRRTSFGTVKLSNDEFFGFQLLKEQQKEMKKFDILQHLENMSNNKMLILTREQNTILESKIIDDKNNSFVYKCIDYKVFWTKSASYNTAAIYVTYKTILDWLKKLI